MHDPIQLGYKNTSKRLNKDIYHQEMQYQIRIKKSNTRIHENTKVNQKKKKKIQIRFVHLVIRMNMNT